MDTENLDEESDFRMQTVDLHGNAFDQGQETNVFDNVFDQA